MPRSTSKTLTSAKASQIEGGETVLFIGIDNALKAIKEVRNGFLPVSIDERSPGLYEVRQTTFESDDGDAGQ